MLLLRRLKAPNHGLCSPIGGKLDMNSGESPAQCARREIMEEAGLDIPLERLHLCGLISETAFEGRGHWLIFYYRVVGPVWIEPHDMREGRLDWFGHDEIEALPLPETDRRIIWPLVRAHDAAGVASADGRPGFFAVHIDCTAPAAGDGRQMSMRWMVEQADAPGWRGRRG